MESGRKRGGRFRSIDSRPCRNPPLRRQHVSMYYVIVGTPICNYCKRPDLFYSCCFTIHTRFPFSPCPLPPIIYNQILALRPLWRNIFENSATVQADHRVLALTTTAAAIGMFWYARRGAAGGALWAKLPRTPKIATTATAALVAGQVHKT